MPRPTSKTSAMIGPYLVRQRQDGVRWKVLQNETNLTRTRLYQLYKQALSETDADEKDVHEHLISGHRDQI